MSNQYNSGYPHGAPSGPGFPMPSAPPGSYAPPPGPPNPSGGYLPPSGPPNPSGGYAPPSGPPTGYPPPGPPAGYAPPGPPASYPPPGPQAGYAPPPGPPTGYAPPPGPPAGYAPPPGPPTGHMPPPGPPPSFHGDHGGNVPPRHGGYPPPPAGPGGQYTPSYISSPNHSPHPGPTPHQPGQQYHQPHGPPPSGYSSHAQNPQLGGAPHMPPTQIQYYGPSPQGQTGQGQQPFFQYSQCNGKKKALCIGINYIGQSGELRGCHNDARNITEFLCRQFGYMKDDIVVLTDDSRNPRQIPTRANIISAMQWLVRDARPNDSLFFHYSGHGGQTKDLDGDEADGFDEVIYPVDFKNNGHIVDDDMHMIMVKPLPPGCRLTAIFDSCHSGSALDLPYMYSTEGKLKEPNLALEAGQGLFSAATSYMKGDMKGVFGGVSSLLKTATGSTKKAEDYSRRTRTSPADVISWSGCKDAQTSADTVEANQATGAMSYAFIQALNANPRQTYLQLLNSIRSILQAKYSQKPQLSSSHPMDTSILFIA